MSALDLLRADLRDFAGYRSARSERLDGDVWLNANEACARNAADGAGVCRRYPDPQPADLLQRLALLYGRRPDELVAGRGSDEAIDLLVRAFCVPGHGAIITTPPTFGMYAVCARLHAVRTVEVPLVEGDDGFCCDFRAGGGAPRPPPPRLVFLCSPGNPTGGALPLESIAALATRLRNRAIVVVDEAYQEFSSMPSAIGLHERHSNVVVLRTLSKAHALAGVRIGVAIGDAPLIQALRRCQAPYPLPEPCVDVALRALEPAVLAATRGNVQATIAERARLFERLEALPEVKQVYTSDANFLLARFENAQAAFDALLAAGIVVRDMRAQPVLADALRITIGKRAENDRVLEALAGVVA